MSLRRLLNVAYIALAQNKADEKELDAFDRELETPPPEERRSETRDRERTAAGNRNADLLMQMSKMPQVGQPPPRRPPTAQPEGAS